MKTETGSPQAFIQQSTVGNLLLALWAVVTAAAGDDDALDGSFADQAPFPFAAVDAMLELEESFFAIRVDVVGNGRSAERDGLPQDFLDCGMQLGQFVAVDGRCTTPRTNAGAEQRLI